MQARNLLVKSAAALAAMAALAGATAALAQRDPAYATARANGEVGERMDGYLGIVGAPTPELKKLVGDINIKRKQVYFEQAQEQHVTPEEYSFSAGCKAISRTAPGEKYQAPDGTWKTRTGAPPELHSKCV